MNINFEKRQLDAEYDSSGGHVLINGYPEVREHINLIETKKGVRFNEGKNRFDLLEPFAVEKLSEVFTMGAKKYAPNNWLKGMEWSKITASLKRHLNAYEQGIDYDPESGLLHAQHIAWNAMALISYYKHCPQYDDRQHSYLKHKKIGLDIDEVLADWLTDWCNYWKIDVPKSWFFDRNIMDKFNKMKEEGKLDGFYLNLKPLINPNDLPFEPEVYITSRPVDTKITEQWLDMWGFPSRPVVTVGLGQSKVEVLKDHDIDIFIDDRFQNFVEINNAGILCLLMDMPHNQRYKVGYRRLKNFADFKERFM